ncbi:MAG: hypothetical protein K2O85_04180 [Helicobacter sp.]|nr:hypothetical protein [Helicobacter sp.]
MDIFAFKQINWVTNTLWLLFYTVALLLFLTLYWRGYVEDFKATNVNYRREEILVSETHKQYTTLLAQKNSFEANNTRAINKMHSTLDSKQLAGIFAGSSVKPLKTPTQKNKNVAENRFEVSGVVKNTRELRDMLRSIENNPFVMEINFPVRFEKTKRGLKYSIGVRAFNTTIPESGIVGRGGAVIPPSALPDSAR